ncbi:FG-GAP repeat protein [Streptosporangium sp. KLBMP 9127]|nr:FG-GAP repeat protein [Streptosporangium sp. KLBMP 9127]
MKLLVALAAAALLPLVPTQATQATQAAPAARNCSDTTATSDFDGDGTDDVAVGDPFADLRGQLGAGTVQILRGGSGAGSGATVLGAPEPAAGDGFGWSVALGRVDGDACADLLVGAPYTDVNGQADAGAVYVLYGGTGRSAKFVATRPERKAHFGWSVAHSVEDAAVSAIGAPHQDSGETGTDDEVRDAGAVYLLRGGRLTQITQENEGVPGNSENGDMFGWSLALGRLGGERNGVDLAVGSPYENNDGAGRQIAEGMLDTGGLTVVFDPARAGATYTGRKWEMRDLVGKVAREAPGDRFGYALSYAAGRLAVSAPLADAGGVKDAGLVHVLPSASGPAKGDTIFQGGPSLEGEPGPGEAFGFSVALDGTGTDVRLAAGIPFDGPDRRGAVQLVPLRTPQDDRLITAAAPRAEDHFGWSVGFSGDRLVAGAPDASTGGAVALVGGGSSTPVGPTGDASADFGATVAG